MFGTKKEAEYGTVTAMDIDSDCECLVCGYERGQLVFWDLSSQTVLKTIQKEHQSAILAVKFWKEGKSNIISGDSSGKVLTLQVNKGVFSSKVTKEMLLDSDGGTGPICSITVIRKDIVRNSKLKDCVLAALCSPMMVLVVKLEPKIEIIFKNDRPFDLKENIIPSCAWGAGAIPGSPNNTDPLLALVWGNKLQLLQVASITEEDGKGFRPCGYFYNEPPKKNEPEKMNEITYSQNEPVSTKNEIIYVGFVSKNLIAIVDGQKRTKILYSGYLSPTDHEANELDSPEKEIDSKKKSEPDPKVKSAELDVTLVDPDLIAQSIKDEEGIVYHTYQNSVFTIDTTRRVFLLARQSVYIGRLSNWKEHIEILLRKGEWLSALATCLEIYRGTNKMFADIPSDERECSKMMKPFFTEIISKYIHHVGSLHTTSSKDHLMTNPNEIWEMVILTAIDFLVCSENFTFLFDNIRNQLKFFGQLDNFISNLEPFILHNKITYIPNEPFKEIARFFSNKGKSEVLEHLILNLNIKSIDENLTITLCKEHNLITSLLYVCTHSKEPDYITPCCKLIFIYQCKLREGAPDARKAGYQCLWFFRLIFQAKKFPKGTIEKKEWKSAILNIVILIFAEQALRDLLDIDPPIFFNLIGPLFRGEMAKILEEHHKELVERYRSENIYMLSPVKLNKHEVTAIIEEKNMKEHSAVHLQMLEALYRNCVNVPLLNYHLALFMAEIIVEKKYPLKVEVIKKLLEILLQTREEKPEEKITNATSPLHAAADEDSEEWQAIMNNRSQLYLKLMKNFHTLFTNEDFASLYALSAPSP